MTDFSWFGPYQCKVAYGVLAKKYNNDVVNMGRTVQKCYM